METLSLSMFTTIIQTLGLPGLVIVFWYFDHKKDRRNDEIRQQELAERERSLNLVLGQYKSDISEIKRLYENNVHLVEDYQKINARLERLYSETIAVISLNTQTQAQMVKTMEHYLYPLKGKTE
ncbi:hypothetical protein LJC22_06220 [Desulfosarcina sp. OttesenSCG-928-G10]|nr:hypothetical protein [Desulfosarcina sp. OttesenSCG-928-G10]MDL2320757.1 hypothetical protein [Desulfosarcina sp. OttesenSCG-928-B08]